MNKSDIEESKEEQATPVSDLEQAAPEHNKSAENVIVNQAEIKI